jgi:hypothetical protein
VSHQDVLISSVASGQPGPPTAVTSITRDAGATVSFLPPASTGSSSITAYVVTPYVAGVAQAPQVVPVASLTTLVGSDGNSYRQAPVSSLTNSTAYTFTVKARNSGGDSTESGASGANTPLAGLVFGDDFNGPTNGQIDPEWWIYSRCGYLAQSEVEWYKPDHCVLDGSGNLKLIAEHVPQTGTTYPSDGNRTVTQPWTAGGCQSNAKTWVPATGNTMTFESKFTICANSGNGYWPGLFWLNGQSAMSWKTDPLQGGWNDTDHAEIDIAEWPSGQSSTTQYLNNTWITSSPEQGNITAGVNLSAAPHVYSCQWKPGVSTTFFRDGSQTHRATTSIPLAGCHFVLLLYLQMVAGGPTTTEACVLDYVRVYDQNLG